MPQFKAVIFDLDGTLINSEYFYFESWNILLHEYGVQLTFEDWMQNYVGKTLPVNARHIIGTYQLPVPLDDLITRREQLSVSRFQQEDVPLMPYAVELLQFIKERHIPMAIVTSSARADVEAIFARNGLQHYFQFIITRDDISLPKPHPEGYLQACQRLGQVPSACLVIEDTTTGLSAAKAAGAVCYAVQSNRADHEKLTAADRLFLSLHDVEKYILQHQLL
ncbi:HAD family phosphatase [Mucilaginibacter koreensis]